jgi:hypothetical protein
MKRRSTRRTPAASSALISGRSGLQTAPPTNDPDAGDAKSEDDAGASAVLGEALGDIGLRRAGRPGECADLDVDDGGCVEAGEKIVEDEVGVRVVGPRCGGEEARAVEPREEGVPDAARDGRVGGERLVEGGLVLAAVVGLERLVEEAGAVDERAEIVGGGAVAGHLVLRRAEVGHGACAGSERLGTTVVEGVRGVRTLEDFNEICESEIMSRPVFNCIFVL